MKPGEPVFTTSLSLCRVSMRLISLNASSGRAEISKFSRARAALFGVVSTAVPLHDNVLFSDVPRTSFQAYPRSRLRLRWDLHSFLMICHPERPKRSGGSRRTCGCISGTWETANLAGPRSFRAPAPPGPLKKQVRLHQERYGGAFSLLHLDVQRRTVGDARGDSRDRDGVSPRRRRGSRTLSFVSLI